MKGVFRRNTITGMMCYGLKVCGSVFLGNIFLFSSLLHLLPLKWTAPWSYINYSSCTCLCGLGRKVIGAITFSFLGGVAVN
jgi:hypothetical protein